MKCQNCGSELEEGVLFCRDCGSKVEYRKISFCRECGSEITEGAKYCENCGASIEFSTSVFTQGESETTDEGKNVRLESPEVKAFGQIPRIQSDENAIASKTKGHGKLIVVAVAIFAVVLIVIGVGGVARNSSDQTSNAQQASYMEPTNYTIEKGSQYAFMSDEANVYIATAVSDSIIKLERWSKNWLPQETMDHEADLGAFKINDPENGFSWVDDEHTAFNLTFSDSSTSSVRASQSHVFTINISNSDRFKGTNYDKDIACFVYYNDDWHMYRAIPLNNSLIKVERWSRTNSLPITGYCYSGDWCLIDTNSSETDFEWTDGEHTSFTITTRDPDNEYYWKQDSFVVFELENQRCKYASVKDYLESQ